MNKFAQYARAHVFAAVAAVAALFMGQIVKRKCSK